MRAASMQCLSFIKIITVATLVCALIPFGGLQAQTNAQPDPHSEIAAASSSPGAAVYAQPATGALRGVTRDGLLPVAGVQLIVHSVDAGTDRSVVSGKDGIFSVGNLKPGTYRVTAVRNGLVGPTVTVDVASGERLRIDMALGGGTTAAEHETPQPAPAPDVPAPNTSASAATTSNSSVSTDADVPPAVEKKLEAMEERIAELEAQLKDHAAPTSSAALVAPAPAATAAPALTPAEATTPTSALASAPVSTPGAAPAAESASTPALNATPSSAGVNSAAAVQPLPSLASVSMSTSQDSQTTSSSAPPKKAKIDPFSDWDWTWLNGNPRTKDIFWDSKFFTPEIRADTTYTYDTDKPADDSMGGSSELFRSNEVQLEQLGLGGDFHWDNVRARFMTQFGMYSEATIRNDATPSKGQWNIADALRYMAEAYGGYHINVLDGVNIDAGIFMSYIGLFSYYNFDNWAYQPSYVSSNTPWFFEGVRIQIFPTPHIKIEPWIINGWQSYGTANNRKGLGGQFKWTPTPYINVISNNYGMGEDDLYIPGRERIHTDNSFELKWYNHPERFMDRIALSLTGDLGCEYGAGVSCMGDKPNAPKQSFIGYMEYNRFWFHKDLYAITFGGGQINNPGRYLVLDPPINGETAASAAVNAPYYTGNPGDPFKAWDASFTFDYMPSQYITFRFENAYRHADEPYWTGHGGVTPPSPVVGGGFTNNGNASDLVCINGADSGVAGSVEQQGPLAAGAQASLVQANNNCVSMGDGGRFVSYGLSSGEGAVAFPKSTPSTATYPGLWFPDRVKDEDLIDLDILVKF
jgi:hypothetical protein